VIKKIYFVCGSTNICTIPKKYIEFLERIQNSPREKTFDQMSDVYYEEIAIRIPFWCSKPIQGDPLAFAKAFSLCSSPYQNATIRVKLVKKCKSKISISDAHLCYDGINLLQQHKRNLCTYPIMHSINQVSICKHIYSKNNLQLNFRGIIKTLLIGIYNKNTKRYQKIDTIKIFAQGYCIIDISGRLVQKQMLESGYYIEDNIYMLQCVGTYIPLHNIDYFEIQVSAFSEPDNNSKLYVVAEEENQLIYSSGMATPRFSS
jgi:hypothetical protein